MDNLNKLQEQIKAFMDKATDKEQIGELASMNDTIKAISDDTTSLKNENKELLDSYKELVKHTSFSQAPATAQPAGPKFEDFFK